MAKPIGRNTARAAMGPRDGDSLKLGNQWHSVRIVRDAANGGYWVYGEAEPCFKKLPDALTAAWAELAKYERGRCD